jgi:hypothetical protein
VKIVSPFDAIVEMEYRLFGVWVFKTGFRLQRLLLPEWSTGPAARGEKAETSV